MFGFNFSFFGLKKSETDKTNAREAEVDRRWNDLLKNDCKHDLLHDFAAFVLAQELSDEEFKDIVTTGEKDIASYFFEVDPDRGDILSKRQVLTLLNEPDLKFMVGKDIKSGFETVKDFEIRALRILTGYAGLEPAALSSLIISDRCALVALAIWREHLLGNEGLIQVVAALGGFKGVDIKCYCQDPEGYVVDDDSSLRDTDIVVIETMRQHPDRIFDLLFPKSSIAA